MFMANFLYARTLLGSSLAISTANRVSSLPNSQFTVLRYFRLVTVSIPAGFYSVKCKVFLQKGSWGIEYAIDVALVIQTTHLKRAVVAGPFPRFLSRPG